MKSLSMRIFRAAWILLLILAATQPTRSLAAPAPDEMIPPQADALSDGDDGLESAVMQAIHGHEEVSAFALDLVSIERVQYDPSGDLALVYLQETNPQTGEVYAREPGLAIARRSTDGVTASATGEAPWAVTLQADEDFSAVLASVPDELLGDDMRQRFLPTGEEVSAASTTATFGGYLLPWAGGVAKQLSWSVSHASCLNNACRYAFDFEDGTMFPILAAKGGTVFAAVWNWENGDENHTNYLVLRDGSTNPVSFQVYYHLAKDSVPVALRTPGAVVQQGQFIGNADDTGYSTGHHLHFMVHTSTYGYWGTSVDITFKDVSINYDPVTGGGRPRMVKEAASYGGQGQDWYTSGNRSTFPPTGGLTAPVDGVTLTSRNLTVSGYASDNEAVQKLEILANDGSGWKTINQPTPATAFTSTFDVCSAGVPDGPVTLALRVYDNEGNQTVTPQTPRNVLVKAGCGAPHPPSCTPGDDEVALFSGVNYTGVCQVFGAGSLPDGVALGNIGADATASIKLGKNVSATLYRDPDYETRAETFTSNDPNLSDNRVGTRSVSSMKVLMRTDKPLQPVLITPKGAGGAPLTTDDSIVLAWENGGGATKFEAELYAGSISGSPFKTLSFAATNSWSIGSLAAGSYSWRVRGRIADAGNNPHYSDWSGTGTFTVTDSGSSLPASVTFPYSDDLEGDTSGWTLAGLWHRAQITGPSGVATYAWVFNNGTHYSSSSPQAGDLTTPPIPLPAGGPFFLRFDYRYQTESGSLVWDQRRVQISVGDDPFQDLVQLSDDPMQTWLNSPVIPIASSYAGHTIRLRFHFDTIDTVLNSYEGWAIDNISITSTAPAAGDGNAVSPIAYGVPVSGDIQPGGDLDRYSFTGKAGEVVIAEVSSATPLALSLLASDGASIVAGCDPYDPGTGRPARLSFRIPSDGVYYLQVTANSALASAISYSLSVQKSDDRTPPAITLNAPGQNNYLPVSSFQLSATATDNSGISRVDFFYHLPDWASGKWLALGTDSNGGDGWSSMVFDPHVLGEQRGYAIWARAYDAALNVADAVYWSYGVDRTPPAVTVSGAPAQVNSTAAPLPWSGGDNLSGIDHFDVQYQQDGGAWQDWDSHPAGGEQPAWFVGEFGHTYGLRMRAIDRAGNVQAFPSAAQVTVTLVDPGMAASDQYESDCGPGQAVQMSVNAPPHLHSFYGLNDEDWIGFDAQSGKLYILRVQPLPGSAAAGDITLWSADGQTQLSHASAGNLGGEIDLVWKSNVTGRVYAQVRSIDSQVAGRDVEYQVFLQDAYYSYLPNAFR